jgi:hypothetical protein
VVLDCWVRLELDVCVLLGIDGEPIATAFIQCDGNFFAWGSLESVLLARLGAIHTQTIA